MVYTHTLRGVYIRDVGIYIYIIYHAFTYVYALPIYEMETERKKKSLVWMILPRLYRYYVGARTSTSADCVRRLPAAAEDHIAGRCAAGKGGRGGGYAAETSARQNRSTESVEHVNLHIGRDPDARSPIKYALISPRLSPPPHRSPFGYRLFGWVYTGIGIIGIYRAGGRCRNRLEYSRYALPQRYTHHIIIYYIIRV